MTRDDVLKVLTILRGAYPNFYRGMDKQEALSVVDLWTNMFAEDEPALVGAAVKALIATDDKGFPPHIGAVKAKMRQISQPKAMTESEAWDKIRRALSNGIYGAKEEYDKLPPILQRLVGSPSQLKEWACMDSETVQSVVASNVQRAYRVMEQRERDMQYLPDDIRAIAAGIGGEKLAIGDGEMG